MKLYLVQVAMYDYSNIDLNTTPSSNVYSSFQKAKEEGLKKVKKAMFRVEKEQNMSIEEMLDKEMLNYDFYITEIEDLEYAEKFDIKYKLFERDNKYSKLEPTHKVYELDYKGNLVCIYYEYRYKNALWKSQCTITAYPEDLEEGASEKFKIGDIVKLKNTELDSFTDKKEKDRLYVVRYLPRKFNGEKYFNNKYALISLYKTDNNEWGNKELFTNEYWEKNIEKYTGKIKTDSEYDLLSRIIKGNIRTNRDYWNKIKIGKLPLNIKTFEEENAENEDDWGFFSTAITPNRTGLAVTIFPAKNYLDVIKDYLPKMRVQNKIKDYQDTFSISLEENPRVVIGENKLSKEDYQAVCDFIRNNLDILLRHFDPEDEYDETDLWEDLKQNGSVKKRVNITPNIEQTVMIDKKDTGLRAKIYITSFNVNTQFISIILDINNTLILLLLDEEINIQYQDEVKQEYEEIINEVIDFIKANKKTFIIHWKGKMTDREFLHELPLKGD